MFNIRKQVSFDTTPLKCMVEVFNGLIGLNATLTFDLSSWEAFQRCWIFVASSIEISLL